MKKKILNTYFGLWEKIVSDIWRVFYAGLSHLHSAYRGELLRWKIFLPEFFSIIVSRSVLGKKTFSKGTLNFTFFVRSWANQFWASGKKTWSRAVEGAFYWASESFPVERFLKIVQFCNFSEFEWSTCDHSAKTFWQCCQSCILVVERT